MPGLWATPVAAVGTDPKMAVNAALTADPGLLTGAAASPPAIFARVANPARKAEILAKVVIGSLINEAFNPPIPPPDKIAHSGFYRALRQDLKDHFPDENLDAMLDPKFSNVAESMKKIESFVSSRLENMFIPPKNAEGAAYEARVLEGIWAKAPYLHNGSVPNLWELLKPAKDRVTSFKVGSRLFDPRNVGYDTQSSPFANATFAADPATPNGNSNSGHVYGTSLSEEERWQIVEYLKTL